MAPWVVYQVLLTRGGGKVLAQVREWHPGWCWGTLDGVGTPWMVLGHLGWCWGTLGGVGAPWVVFGTPLVREGGKVLAQAWEWHLGWSFDPLWFWVESKYLLRHVNGTLGGVGAPWVVS